MPPLPTMSLRVDPQHQAVIRDVARALRDQPELADVLRDVLRRNTQGDEPQASAYDDVLQRVAALEDAMRNATRRIAELEAPQQGESRAHHVDPAEEYGKPAALAPTPLEEAIAAAEVCTTVVQIPDSPVLATGANQTEGPLKDARNRLTEAGVLALREMVAAGATTKAIADRFGWHSQNVARALRRYLGEEV